MVVGCQPYAPAAFTPRNIPGTHFHYGLSRPQGHGLVGKQAGRVPLFPYSRHMKTVSLSTQNTGCLYHPGFIPCTHFCQRLSQLQGDSAAGRIKSMKNRNKINGTRTREVPASSTVPLYFMKVLENLVLYFIP